MHPPPHTHAHNTHSISHTHTWYVAARTAQESEQEAQALQQQLDAAHSQHAMLAASLQEAAARRLEHEQLVSELSTLVQQQRSQVQYINGVRGCEHVCGVLCPAGWRQLVAPSTKWLGHGYAFCCERGAAHDVMASACCTVAGGAAARAWRAAAAAGALQPRGV